MEKYERPKPHVRIGTIGHVDHGKDSLTKAITRILESPKNFEGLSNEQKCEICEEDKDTGITLNKSYKKLK